MTLVLHDDGTSFFCTECKETVQRTRDNPLPEHKCKTAPLNLRAVEARLHRRGSNDAFEASDFQKIALELLAHVNALRAALESTARLEHVYGEQSRYTQLSAGQIRHANDVLAQAKDD